MKRLFKDASLVVTRALTAADGSVTSPDIYIGANAGELDDVEFSIEVPALTATELASADTLTIVVQTGNSASPTTASGVQFVITGTGSAIAAQELRFKASSNFGSYINVKFTTAGTTGDMSAKSVTIAPRF